jgi:pimeloyl-ACP methyl ester carboxylesterase
VSATRRTVTLPSGQVAHYRRVGSGPPLLYLHSFLAQGDDDEFVDRMARHFDLVMPVAPGYEDLLELADLDDGHDLAIFYDDFLRHLGFDRIDVLGHSYGGLIAAELASHFPERVGALALVAPFGLWVDVDPPADLARLPAARLRQRLSANQAEDPDDIESIIAATRAMTATLKFLWPFPDRRLAKRLYRISSPTRVYWGRDDDVNPPGYAARFAAAIEGATTEELAGRHLLPQDQPDLMAERLTEFLAVAGSLASPEV